MAGTHFSRVVSGGVPLPSAGGLPSLGNHLIVDPGNVSDVYDRPPYQTIQAAVNAASAGDVILIAPGEYDEDVTISTAQLTIVGAGPRHSVRVTGIATGSGGTATAMTVAGASDVNLLNLNLEGRAGGGGLLTTGQIRRLQVTACKLHGGTNALEFRSASGAQVVDVRVEGCVLANATNGLNITYSGGDAGHQIYVRDCLFQKIVTDCVVQNGATHDITIQGSTFTAVDGTEPTQFLDIDDVGTTGLVADNFFHTTVFSTAKFAIAAGVLFAGNVSQAENPSAGVGGTSGRPD
jgi:hypothetical protein